MPARVRVRPLDLASAGGPAPSPAAHQTAGSTRMGPHSHKARPLAATCNQMLGHCWHWCLRFYFGPILMLAIISSAHQDFGPFAGGLLSFKHPKWTRPQLYAPSWIIILPLQLELFVVRPANINATATWPLMVTRQASGACHRHVHQSGRQRSPTKPVAVLFASDRPTQDDQLFA